MLRNAHRLVVGAVVVAAIVAVAAPAWAHVTIQPGTARKGSVPIFSFAVPNEESEAATVQVEVVFPTDHPIPSVSVQPKPGWSVHVERAPLAEPAKTDDGEVTAAVSRITWSGGTIGPGEFDLFTVSAGPLPTNTRSIEFKVLQTYSNGDVVRWIESSPKGGPEPEHPAPRLKLVGKARVGASN
jgi:uncharacterized protein YcnI